MKPTISIKFDQNEHGVYYSGQVVSGKVEITCLKAKKVRAIAIKITGLARTQWKTKYRSWNEDGQKSKTGTSQFTGCEDYLSSTTYLVGSENATPTQILPGIHTYNFASAIPSFAPSSFEGSHGYIRYVVKVILDRPWKFDQTYSVGFTVLKPVDLNYDSPLLRIPAEVEIIKKFWCGCTSNPLHLRAKLSQTGFVPGQVIPIRTEINNGSNAKVSEIKFTLRKIVSYSADVPQTDYKEEIIDLVCRTSGSVTPKGTINFEELLLVPAIPPTSQFQSRIIQINYDVKVEVVMMGGYTNPFVTCPITIGTVPLVNSSQQPLGMAAPFDIDAIQSRSEPTSSYFQNRTDFSGSEAPMSLPIIGPVYNREPTTPNSNIPPPTYEESVMRMRARVDEGEEHPLQRTEFVPRYPVFHFDTPSAPHEFEIAQDEFEGKFRT